MIADVRSQSDRYKLAIAIADGNQFLEKLPIAFSGILWAEDNALRAIAPLIGREAPPYWNTETDANPY